MEPRYLMAGAHASLTSCRHVSAVSGRHHPNTHSPLKDGPLLLDEQRLPLVLPNPFVVHYTSCEQHKGCADSRSIFQTFIVFNAFCDGTPEVLGSTSELDECGSFKKNICLLAMILAHFDTFPHVFLISVTDNKTFLSQRFTVCNATPSLLFGDPY